MPELAVVMSEETPPAIGALVRALREELDAQGVLSTVGASFPEPGHDRVWCLVAAPGAGDHASVPDDTLARTVVIAPCAPTPDGPERALLGRAGVVFALEERVVAELGRHGVAARLLRPGWSPSLDRFADDDPDRDRSVEIALAGLDGPRGAAWRRAAEPVLARRRCERLSAADRRPWGALAGARVCVHLHGRPDDALGWRPLLEAALTGTVLVTEHAADLSPFVPGEHLLAASADALADVAAAALEDPARLERIRGAAHARARDWQPLALPASFLRAAIVELLAVPVTPR